MLSKKAIEDIKTVFDAIRNIGLCAALTLGLPFIEQSASLAPGGNWIKLLASTCTITVIIGLYILNLVWLFSNLTAEPISKGFHVASSIAFVSIVSIAIGGTAFLKAFGNLSTHF